MYKSAENISSRNFVGKYASIQTSDNKTHNGFIYVVDPETKTVVLTEPNEATEDSKDHSIIIIPAPSIKIIVLNETRNIGEINIFPEKKERTFSIEELQVKKKKITDWFKLNLIDMKEEGDKLKFQDHLIIEPPYDLQHCYCTNTIVLDRFKSLIEKMPVE